MKKLTWAVENSSGETGWVYESDELIRAMDFDGHQAALDWLAENFDTLRPSNYRVVAKIDEVQE